MCPIPCEGSDHRHYHSHLEPQEQQPNPSTIVRQRLVPVQRLGYLQQWQCISSYITFEFEAFFCLLIKMLRSMPLRIHRKFIGACLNPLADEHRESFTRTSEASRNEWNSTIPAGDEEVGDCGNGCCANIGRTGVLKRRTVDANHTHLPRRLHRGDPERRQDDLWCRHV